MIYTLVTEPKNELYSKLLIKALKSCNSFIFVVRPTISTEKSVQKIIDDLQQYLIKKSAESEWPGTKLINDTALVYKFQLNKETTQYLVNVSSSLYSWLQPDFPEDLCLLRENGKPWLTTISHEKDAYLLLSEEEKEEILTEIPELILKEALTN